VRQTSSEAELDSEQQIASKTAFSANFAWLVKRRLIQNARESAPPVSSGNAENIHVAIMNSLSMAKIPSV
jgi:hypothetical protein